MAKIIKLGKDNTLTMGITIHVYYDLLEEAYRCSHCAHVLTRQGRMTKNLNLPDLCPKCEGKIYEVRKS